MQYEDTKFRPLPFRPHHLPRRLNILLKLLHRILQRRPRIIHLVHDQDVLSHQIRHLQGAEIEPLRSRDLGAGLFDRIVVAESLVEGQADGLDGDVGGTRSFQKGPEE